MEPNPVLLEVTASRADGDRITVNGIVETRSLGWAVRLEEEPPGTGDQFDKELRLVLTATPPQVRGDQIDQVGFGGTFQGEPGDERVAIRLDGVDNDNPENPFRIDIN